MKSIPLRLCALALALTSACAAQAADHVDTAAFTMSGQPDAYTDIELISSAAGVTRISMLKISWNLNSEAHGHPPGEFQDFEYDLFSMKVAPGYRVTGFSLDGTVDGALQVGEAPPWIHDAYLGTADNRFNFDLAAASRNDVWGDLGSVSLSLKDKVAPTPFSLGKTGLALGGDFFFQSLAAMSAGATPTRWSSCQDEAGCHAGFAESYARGAVYNPVLTVYTALAPVPEPETYAMLLAGLAAIGVARRRRRA